MPELIEVIENTLALKLNDVHTSMPARVERVDLVQNVVDVQPLLRARVLQEDGTVVLTELPLLAMVPLEFRGGGGFRETWPVAVGDVVRLEFTEAALDNWWKLGGLTDVDGRRFHLTDAVAVPGLRDSTAKWTGGAEGKATWGRDGGPQLVGLAGELHLGASSTDPATEQLIKGTSYRTHEDTRLNGHSTTLAKIAGELGTASGLLAAAAASNAVPIVGGVLALPSFTAVIAQLALIVTDLATLTSQIASFQASAATDLSAVVKTK